jgi:hypothetical protein
VSSFSFIFFETILLIEITRTIHVGVIAVVRVDVIWAAEHDRGSPTALDVSYGIYSKATGVTRGRNSSVYFS